MTERDRLDLTVKWLRAVAKAKRATGQRFMPISIDTAEEIASWLDEHREATADWEELAS